MSIELNVKLSITEALETNDKDNLIKALKDRVSMRNKMCGNLWYNILNDECCQIANRCLELGADKSELDLILGQDTFC